MLAADEQAGAPGRAAFGRHCNREVSDRLGAKAIVQVLGAARSRPVEYDRPGGRAAVAVLVKSDRAEVAALNELAARSDARGVGSDRPETIVSKHSTAFAGARGVG